MAAVGSWDDIRFFLAIARGGSLAAAARTMAVDQSTVSRHLCALEESLAARLFERHGDGLRITGAGLAIRESAERAEEAIVGLGALAASTVTGGGRVHLETSPIFAEYFLGPRLGRIKRRCPDIELTVTTGRQMINIHRHEADLALRQLPAGMAPASSSVIAQKLGEFSFAPYASRGYLAARGMAPTGSAGSAPRRVVELERFDLVALESPSGCSPGSAWVESLGHAPELALNARDLVVVVAAIRADLGVGIVPCVVANALGDLTRVGPVVERYTSWIAMPADARHSPWVRRVKDVVVEVVREDAAVFDPAED